MAYAYQADVYCDRCGQAIIEEIRKPTLQALTILHRARKAIYATDSKLTIRQMDARAARLTHAMEALKFPDDEPLTDSDYIPQWADDDEERDSPQHCAAGADCLQALTLTRNGLPYKVGYLFGRLTRDGYDYTIEQIKADPADELMQEWASHFDIRIEYVITFAAYCGMVDTEEKDCGADARDHVAAYLRSMRRKGFPVTTLKRGAEWEVLEPEDCAMVPDECGTVSLDINVKA